ncbi:chromosome transmission fidelity protein 18 [Gaeumannomyces tritici R3-111a-1]|uniref:Chromosome transmission fidelity protein 18 n=1 Tax=Gaeumannomyces tritici (strain R3-111a-1) TaxID=644352 RepID=J3NP24_GAET3|nr:chromosome transmission fidelity protein 18 [Gaeumannomyces tritici R3-111a-1]EJT77927.1 chromosome transmission fidelity protein 18 [Gaeumannomyces tritici R3-111a-1]
MLASSPISYPQTSSPPRKRPLASPTRGNGPPQKPKARTRAGFMLDDDSDDDESELQELASEPAPKRILVDHTINTKRSLHGALDILAEEEPEAAATNPGTRRSEPAEEADEEERYRALFDRPAPTQEANYTIPDDSTTRPLTLQTCSGKSLSIRERKPTQLTSYENIVAARSRHKEGRAKRSYYGIEIHALMDAAEQEEKEKILAEAAIAEAAAQRRSVPAVERPVQSVETVPAEIGKRPKKTLLWTEKYRARKFMDLVGDDLTNRQVLRWLKRWDPVVFPQAAKSKAASRRIGAKAPQQQQGQEDEKPHRKILMLTGPPGLGKTTLAHVCAKQAGYEVLEINASDDRSRDVVKGRIRTSLGTENVKTVEQHKPKDGKPGQPPPKIARPVCVVVDEVDGVVSGSGGSGEGGFVKALIDLVTTDQKNSAAAGLTSDGSRRKKKGDDFRQMRPLILICNDVYHVSLRPLRQSGLAEIIHVGKPTIDSVVTRLKNVFEKEGIPCEKDAARKLCEAAWGMTSGINARRGAESTVEGDLRGVMVVGEWVAGRLRATSTHADGSAPRLTRQWVDLNVVGELAHGGGGARGLGRGGTKDVVARVFQEGAGFPKQQQRGDQGLADRTTRREQPQAQLGFAEHDKKHAMARLGEMVDASGEVDRIMTEIFAEFPGREFNDDCYLSKPNTAYEWMNFHDMCSTRLFTGQEWELAPYLSQPVLACHSLFASPRRHVPNAGYDRNWGGGGGNDDGADGGAAPVPFSGPRADYEAREAEKHNRAALQAIQANLSPALARSFRSPEHVATDLLPYLLRLVSPNVKPVVVGGSGGGDKGVSSIASVRRESEKTMVRRAAEVLAELNIDLVKGKIEEANPSAFARPQWVYRLEPDIDALSTFDTMGAHVLSTQAPTRYAVRQVLDQELHKTRAARDTAARQARFRGGGGDHHHEGAEPLPVNPGKENPAATAKRGVDVVVAPEAPVAVKRDFFGRIIAQAPRPLQDADGNAKGRGGAAAKKDSMVWVTFNEGLNNAVRKPITLDEFLRGL